MFFLILFLLNKWTSAYKMKKNGKELTPIVSQNGHMTKIKVICFPTLPNLFHWIFLGRWYSLES